MYADRKWYWMELLDAEFSAGVGHWNWCSLHHMWIWLRQAPAIHLVSCRHTTAKFSVRESNKFRAAGDLFPMLLKSAKHLFTDWASRVVPTNCPTGCSRRPWILCSSPHTPGLVGWRFPMGMEEGGHGGGPLVPLLDFECVVHCWKAGLGTKWSKWIETRKGDWSGGEWSFRQHREGSLRDAFIQVSAIVQ